MKHLTIKFEGRSWTIVIIGNKVAYGPGGVGEILSYFTSGSHISLEQAAKRDILNRENKDVLDFLRSNRTLTHKALEKRRGV